MSENKIWDIFPSISIEKLKSIQTHPVVAQVLHNRGYQTVEAVREFFSADGGDANFFLDLNPFELTDMEKAVERILKAIKNEEMIAVYGDFDADGVTSTALMFQALNALGAKIVPYIPDRVDEGYGLNDNALKTLFQSGITLVITVDCGIRSVSEIQTAAQYGLDVIVTDHHHLGDQLPTAAIAIVNPQRGEGDYKYICGCAVAFFLITAICQYLWRNTQDAAERHIQKYRDFLDELIDLVAIGTVADMMPLNIKINRQFVQRGLIFMNDEDLLRMPLKYLKQISKINSDINSTSIGFNLAPRLNAAGRLARADTAFQLLISNSAERCTFFAQELDALNKQRQKLTKEAFETLVIEIEENKLYEKNIIILQGDILGGIIGLVAGKLCEKYQRPVIVFENGSSDDFMRASCRSIEGYHILNALETISEKLVKYGGHAQAAGLTIHKVDFDIFKSSIEAHAEKNMQVISPRLRIDALVNLSDVSEYLFNELKILEPFGFSNPQPLFASERLQIIDFKTIGDGTHLKLMFRNPSKGARALEGIFFGAGHLATDLPQFVDIAYYLEVNEWNGEQNIQLNIQDMKPSQQLF